jgi:peptide/nickel transport system ATP-binding protein
MTPILIAEDIRVRAQQTDLVRGVSLSLRRGECLTIVGETGSGKSLLAEAIMGTLTHGLDASGSVVVEGVATPAADQTARRPLWGRTLSLLPQEPWLALDPTMRIGNQVREVLTLVRGQGAAAASRRTDELLKAVGLRGAKSKFPFAISGGMGQRVVFAATRAGEASILIVDEPTKGLDVQLRDGLVDMLKSAVAAGCALLTITHDLTVARALGGHLAVMLDGKVIEEGPATRVLSAPRHDYTRRLIAAEPSHWAAFPHPKIGNPVIVATGVSKSFDGQPVFSGLDVTLAAGERIAITGASGSGKTTLGNLLLGLVQPDTGRVARAAGRASHRFQKLYQDPPAAFPPHASMRAAIGDLIELHGLAWLDADRLMARLRLGQHLLDRRPDEISGGELQRFALLRVLMLKPIAIVADEPTSRLDPITQQDTIALLVEATMEDQIALMLVTHDPDIASKVCSRNVAIHRA